MSRRSIQKCPLVWSALALGLATPVAHAQQTTPEKAAAPNALTPSIGFPAGHEVHAGPTDALQMPVDMTAQSGDDFVLALAEAGDINLICAAPPLEAEVRTGLDPKVRVRLVELARDCNLSWWRAGERTVVMWAQPDEEKLGQAWTQWFREQRASDEASEAVSDEEAAQALKQLKVEDTAQSRQQLRQDYAAFVRARMQAQVRSEVFDYLDDHPLAAQAAPKDDSLEGRTVAVRDLPLTTRQKIAVLSRLSLRRRWDRSTDLWFSPQREEFWKQARLSIVRAHDAQKTRWLQLKGSDPTGALKEAWFTVGLFDPMNVAPDSPAPFRGRLKPRPATGLQITGKQMPLRQVLDAVQKQSGLIIETPPERLSQARLTLDVRGMQPSEFLSALARAFLVEWKVEGQRVTAQDRPDSESDRFFLQLGDLGQYRVLSRRGIDDWREEAEVARGIRDEVGDVSLAPLGVPIIQLSAELQSMVHSEAQEMLFDDMMSSVGGLLPISIEQATLELGISAERRGLVVVGENNKPVPPRLISPPAPAINLMVPEVQAQEIVPLDDAEVQSFVAAEATLPQAGAQAATKGTSKQEDLTRAFKMARDKEARQQQYLEAQMATRTGARQ